MRAWLVYDKEGAIRNADYIAMHRQLAKEFSMTLRLVMDFEVPALLSMEEELPDICFVRTISPELSYAIERKGIRVFNPAMVSEICNDKGKTTAYVEKHTSVPVVPTKRYACELLSKELLVSSGDSVIKAVDGHGGKQVFSTTDAYDLIARGIGQSDFVIQPLIRGAGKDIRVYVIGDSIMGAVEREAKSGFKSNFSLGGIVRPYSLRKEEQEQVEKIVSCFPFGMVGIDFIVDENGQFLFNEIEDVVGARMYYQCYPERNLLRDYFSYITRIV